MEGSEDRRAWQETINAYFQVRAVFWKEIYACSDVYSVIHQERQWVVIDWIDRLSLAPGSRVLEIGCGAGLLSVTLAQRGLRIHAIDSAEAMVDQARRHAIESGAADRLSIDVGDVSRLTFADETFDLVVALGVIPWLEQPRLAIDEMSRVTRPGGQVILTADNWPRLDRLLDPWLNPLFTPAKRQAKRLLKRAGLLNRTTDETETTCHRGRYIDDALARVGLGKVRSRALGFGPFTLFRRQLIPDPVGIQLHHRLQRLADRGVPGFRSSGAQYIVLAKKSGGFSNARREETTRHA